MLEQQVHHGSPAVHPDHTRGRTGRPHGFQDVSDLESHGLDHGPGQMGSPDPSGEPRDRAPGRWVPMRTAQAGERGDDDDALGGVDRPGQWLELRRLVDDAEPVAQPLHPGSGHEDRTLHGVGHRAAAILRSAIGPDGDVPVSPEVPRQGGQKSVHRCWAGGPSVHQDEAAGAERRLGHPPVEARLSEQGGMLVAHHGAHRNAGQRRRRTEHRRCHLGEPPARRSHVCEHARGHVEQVAELVRPTADDDVEQHRARGVGDVGGVHPAIHTTGEVPKDPGVHRGHCQVGTLGDAALLEEPLHLRSREVGVEDEAGLLPDQGKVSGLDEFRASVGRAAVLPDQGAVQGRSGGSVPGDDGLALVGDPDGSGHPAGVGQASGHFAERVAHGPPDLVGIVLYPAGLGEVLGELPVGDVHHPGLVVDDQRAHPGRSGVDGDADRVRIGHRGTVVRSVGG